MIGHSLVKLGQLGNAAEQFRLAAILFASSGDASSAAESSLSMGAALADLGDFPRARIALERSVALF